MVLLCTVLTNEATAAASYTDAVNMYTDSHALGFASHGLHTWHVMLLIVRGGSGAVVM